VAGAGSLMFGMAQTLTSAAIGRMLAGLGVSVMFISMLKLNAEWFREHEFATATGVGILVANFGAVLSAAPLAYLVTLTSWRNVFAAAGVVSLALAGASWLWMRDSPRAADLPSVREMDGLEARPGHAGHWYDGLILVLRNRDIWPGFVVMFAAASTYITFIGLWAVPYLTQVHGMSRTVAAVHTSMSLAGFALASLAAGYLSDRIGRRRPVLIGALALHVACWVPLTTGTMLSAWGSYALFILLGASATGFTMTWSCAKEVSPPALSGMATSIVNAGQFLGVGVLQPLVGWLLDRGWRGQLVDGARTYSPHDYRVALTVLLAFTLTGLAGAFLVRETYCRNVTQP